MLLGAALVGLALTSQASATPATQEGAKAITEGLARYLGKTLIDKGVVTVKPNGDSYDVTYAFDSAKMGMPADGPQIQLGPLTAQITPKDDGTYAYTANHLLVDLTYKDPKAGAPIEFGEHLKNCVGGGVFDTKSMVFLSQNMTCDSAVLTMRSPIEDVDATLGKLTFIGTAKAGSNGDVDFTMSGDMFDLVETITVKDPKNPTPPVAMRSDRVHQEASFTGIRNMQILDVLAYFAGHNFDIGKAEQSEARTKLKAVLPLWQSVTGDMRYENLSVGTPKGIVKIAAVDSKLASTGAIKDARISTTLAMSGLELPDGLVPDWAETLVPKDATINLKLTGVDLDTMAGKVIGTVGTPKTPGQADALKSALLMSLLSSSPHLAFEQSVTAPAFDVKGQGDTTLMPSQQGKATISASSLDAIMTALGNASVTAPSAQQGMMGLAFLKGLAKAGPDGRLIWDIDFDSATKKVTVNGQSFGPGAQK